MAPHAQLRPSLLSRIEGLPIIVVFLVLLALFMCTGSISGCR